MNIHIHIHHSQLDELIQEIRTMASTIQDEIDALATQVAENTTVIESAKTLIDGFSQKLADAVAAAQSAGATPAQLAAITELQSAIKFEDDNLAASVAANTAAAPTP